MCVQRFLLVFLSPHSISVFDVVSIIHVDRHLDRVLAHTRAFSEEKEKCSSTRPVVSETPTGDVINLCSRGNRIIVHVSPSSYNAAQLRPIR